MHTFLTKWKKHFTFAAVLSCFVNMLQLTFPFYMFTIYRSIIVSYSTNSLVSITVAAVFAIGVLGLFTYLRARLLAAAGRDLSLQLREPVFAGMVKGYSHVGRRTYQGGAQDLATLHNYVSTPAVYALFDAPWAPLYLALIFLFQPLMGLIATIGAVIMVGLTVLQEVLVRDSLKEANREAQQNQQFVDSFMRNAEVTNGLGMIGAIRDRFIERNNRVMANQTVSSYHAGTIQALVKPMQNVIQVLIYFTGAWAVLHYGFDFGLTIVAAIMMGRALAPLMQATAAWRQTSQAREAWQRLKNFTEFLERQPASALPLPVPRGAVQARDVMVRLEDRVILNNVSFTLNPGESLGIIGPSGAGKTTLCRVLLGIWPTQRGEVTLDGANIFTWDKARLGPHIGYLPQEVELFSGTLLQNLVRLERAHTPSLKEALTRCGLAPLIERLPQGLMTQVGPPHGLRLSGGQQQLVGLVRAIYRTPRLLVLDEPTANLDEAGEQAVIRILQELKAAGSTCIMVTHKLSLLRAIDKVLVLRSGQVALFGERESVLARLQSPVPPAGGAA